MPTITEDNSTESPPSNNSSNSSRGVAEPAIAQIDRLPSYCAEESAKENRNPGEDNPLHQFLQQSPTSKGQTNHFDSTSSAVPTMSADGGGTNSPQHPQQGTSSGQGQGSMDVDLEQVLRSETARAPFHVSQEDG